MTQFYPIFMKMKNLQIKNTGLSPKQISFRTLQTASVWIRDADFRKEKAHMDSVFMVSRVTQSNGSRSGSGRSSESSASSAHLKAEAKLSKLGSPKVTPQRIFTKS